ncbi:MAG: VOC family protein [Candidatus Saccharibacteria bacterium]
MTNEQPFPVHTLLELHVEDFEPIKDYYQKLGFEVSWMRLSEGFKGYLVLKLDHNVLCFWAGNKHVYEHKYFSQFPKDSKRGYGVEIVLMVDNVESYYQRVKDAANVFEPLEMQPWGLKDFRCVDPAGYYLRFTDKHNILDNKYAVE